MEGPFISKAKSGAQRAEFIQDPSRPSVQRLLDHADVIKRITIAPELPGGMEAIENFHNQKISVSGGHSDACEELIRYLRERCGKSDRGTIPVRPHREMNPPRWPTDCPGDDFPYSWFRRF